MKKRTSSSNDNNDSTEDDGPKTDSNLHRRQIEKDQLIDHFKHLSSPVCIFDNEKKMFICCNDKFLKLTGFDEDECYQFVFNDFKKWIHPNDHSILVDQIGKRLRDFKNVSLPVNDEKFSLHFNFRLNTKDVSNNYISVFAQCSVLEWKNNFPYLILCLLSDITNYNKNNKIVYSINWYNNDEHEWTKVFEEEFLNEPLMLSTREKQIFILIIKDMSATTISKELNIAFHTVRTHWRNILSKTGCNNQRELKQLAIKEGWI
jgi:DNA-binding CsgD family transcriptional regulator